MYKYFQALITFFFKLKRLIPTFIYLRYQIKSVRCGQKASEETALDAKHPLDEQSLILAPAKLCYIRT